MRCGRVQTRLAAVHVLWRLCDNSRRKYLPRSHTSMCSERREGGEGKERMEIKKRKKRKKKKKKKKEKRKKKKKKKEEKKKPEPEIIISLEDKCAA